MSFESPPLPPPIDDLVEALIDIYTHTAGAGDGGVGVGSHVLTYQGVPGSIQPMSSSEAQRYGSLTASTLYEAYIPTMSDSGADITVIGGGIAWDFVSGGIRYKVISEGITQGDGLQKVALQRVGPA
jgi:hypothetical protein